MGSFDKKKGKHLAHNIISETFLKIDSQVTDFPTME
jgi:hypothetical protein